MHRQVETNLIPVNQPTEDESPIHCRRPRAMGVDMTKSGNLIDRRRVLLFFTRHRSHAGRGWIFAFASRALLPFSLVTLQLVVHMLLPV